MPIEDFDLAALDEILNLKKVRKPKASFITWIE
jgi:hypothetical protein